MMPALVPLLAMFGHSFRTPVALQAEILALRHQLLIFQRKNQKQRLRLSVADRLLWVWLSRVWTDWRSALGVALRSVPAALRSNFVDTRITTSLLTVGTGLDRLVRHTWSEQTRESVTANTCDGCHIGL